MNGAYIFELKKAKVAEIRDGAVSWFDRNNELRQLHRLRTQQIHRCTFTTTSHPHFYSTPKLVLYKMHIHINILHILFALLGEQILRFILVTELNVANGWAGGPGPTRSNIYSRRFPRACDYCEEFRQKRMNYVIRRRFYYTRPYRRTVIFAFGNGSRVKIVDHIDLKDEMPMGFWHYGSIHAVQAFLHRTV